MAVTTIPFFQDLKYRGNLTSSNNLNNLTKDGIYYIVGSTPANAPSGVTWCMLIQITTSSSMIHQYIIKPADGKTWVREYSGTPSSWASWKPNYEVLLNSTDSYQRVFLERNGRTYHLHYERYISVANGTQVTSIAAEHAPSSAVYGQNFFQQSSGYGLCRCTVGTTGAVTLSAVTYDQNVAGVFDVYWSK